MRMRNFEHVLNNKKVKCDRYEYEYAKCIKTRACEEFTEPERNYVSNNVHESYVLNWKPKLKMRCVRTVITYYVRRSKHSTDFGGRQQMGVSVFRKVLSVYTGGTQFRFRKWRKIRHL